MTFCEAYVLYGRDSAAIAQACGIDESEAYNLMAARADRDLGIMPETRRKEEKAAYHRAWRAKNKARLAELRQEARI